MAGALTRASVDSGTFTSDEADMPAQFPLRLADARMVAPSVRHLVFERADGQPLPFIPGQFLQIHFEQNGAPTKRSYSIACAPGDTCFEIAVSYVEGGAATALLSGLALGDTVSASGPYGRFCLMDHDQNQRYLLIGTGTGITPYRAMLPAIEALVERRGVEVVLLQGARSGEDLIYAADFETFAERVRGFRYVPCLSRATRDGGWPDERRGYVQSVLAELDVEAGRDIAYLCGNPNMVDQAFEALKGAGLPIPAIRREKYVSSK
jgi:ferredoxin-NADP reductase